MNLDVFKIHSHPYELRINEVPLIDLVREVELPLALDEYDRRIEDGEPAEQLGTRGWLAGDYHYLDEGYYLPSRNLLGEPFERDKSIVLGCTCGITECWYLLVKITLTVTTVTWSDFEQYHREAWGVYDLGPFVFDRRLYEDQLSDRATSRRPAGRIRRTGR